MRARYSSGMQATTIKLDGALMQRLKGLKPRDQTLSGFVREILDGEVRRRKLRAAAESYVTFLRDHPEEAEAMDRWASAPLDRSARSKAKRRK